jgi:hypothetical protein
MDQRFDQRYPADLQVVLRDLDSPDSPSSGTISDISKSGLCVVSPAGLAAGAVVKIEWADSSLFGFVIYSKPDHASFRIGIEVQRVLIGGTDLSQLLRAILLQEMPKVPGLEPAVR